MSYLVGAGEGLGVAALVGGERKKFTVKKGITKIRWKDIHKKTYVTESLKQNDLTLIETR